MQQYLTPSDIATNAIMMRALHRGTILIAEGPVDSRFFERFTDSNSCRITPAFGKDNAVGAIQILDRLGIDGVLAIVDSDFWKLEQTPSPSSNVFLTDTHDIETMILSSRALEQILAEFGDQTKINAFPPIRECLLNCAVPIGALRWISSPYKDRLNLKFDGLVFGNFIDRKNLTINLDILISEIKVNSNNTGLNDAIIKKNLASILTTGHDRWQLCCGHDLVEILFIGLAGNLSNQKFRGVSIQAFNAILRLTYDYAHFRTTQLYQSITAWQGVNPQYKCLL